MAQTTPKPIRIGMIGCGEIAQIMHLPYLSELRGTFELAALCDISPRTLSHCGERFGVPPDRQYASAEAMVEKAGLEAVVVGDRLHAEGTIAALRAGCHVLVEKPMAHSLQACDAMIEAATKHGRILMMAYMKRYDPAYELAQAHVAKMKDLLHVSAHDFIGPNSGFTADIHDVHVFKDAPPNDGAEIHNRRLEEALGPLTDKAKDLYGWLTGLSTHDLAILRGLFGAPKRIVAAIQSRNAHIFHALLEYDHGMTGIIEYAYMPNLKKFDQVLGVYSASQVVKVRFPSPYIPYAATQVEIWEPDGPGKAERPERPGLPEGGGGRGIRESLVTPSYDESFRRELQHFAHCIRTGTPPRTPAVDGRDDVRICIELARAAFA